MSCRVPFVRCVCLGIVAILFLLSAGQVWANMAAPFIRPGAPTPVQGGKQGEKANLIVRRVNAEVGRIIIPKKYLPAGFATPKVSLESPRQSAIHSGMLLATVLSCGGVAVALVRRRKTGAAIAVCVVMLGLVAAIGTVMAATPSAPNPPSGNSGPYQSPTGPYQPPANPQPPLGGAAPANQPLSVVIPGPSPSTTTPDAGPKQKVVIEIVEEGDAIIIEMGRGEPASSR